MNSSSASSFQKLLAICERNKIFRPEVNGNVISSIKYGPLGLLLRKNIYNEWFSFNLHNTEFQTLPVHVQKTVSVSPLSNYASENSLIKEMLEQYANVQPLVGQNVPLALSFSCGCISSSKRISKEKLKTPESDKFLWRPKGWTSLLIAFFCEPSKLMNWFYYWQRQRYVWWRKFSAVPSQFTMSDISQKNNEDQMMSLQMKFPWGSESVETVSLIGNKRLKELHDANFTSEQDNGSMPSLVLCKADLDFAVLAYLYDSFEEKQIEKEDSERLVLRLNHRLAPYKVTVTIANGNHPGNRVKLTDLMSHLVRELKRNSIAVLPNPHSNSGSPESQFRRFDEMGIPYVVVLSEASLVTGLAGLRSRDTTLQEQVHIMELSERLLIYLQMQVGEPG